MQYENSDALTPPSILSFKISVKLVILNILFGQLIFHTLSIGLPYIPNIKNVIDIGNLSKFALDMWIIVVILSFIFIAYSKLHKTKNIMLLAMVFPPVAIMLIGVFREVSIIAVMFLISTITLILLKFTFYRESEKYLIDKANELEKNQNKL